jgi:hypothetical protein
MTGKPPKPNNSSQKEDSCAPKIRHRNGRLPDDLLHYLRNRIPIQGLIHYLGLSHRMDGKIFRFQCPVCQAFHTSILAEANLARCFDCKTNFNPIDMTKSVKNLGFRESVFFLSDLPRFDSPENPQRKNSLPETIGTILGKTVQKDRQPSSEIEVRISELQEEIQCLKLQMQRLQVFVVNAIKSERA